MSTSPKVDTKPGPTWLSLDGAAVSAASTGKDRDMQGTYLKWLIDWRTSSSNSIGPGMRSAGCSGCLDMSTMGDPGSQSENKTILDAIDSLTWAFDKLLFRPKSLETRKSGLVRGR